MSTNWQVKTITPTIIGDPQIVFALIYYNNLYFGIGSGKDGDYNFIMYGDTLNSTPNFKETQFFGVLFCLYKSFYAQNENIVIAITLMDNSSIAILNLNNYNDESWDWSTVVFDQDDLTLTCVSVTFFSLYSRKVFLINTLNHNFYYSIDNGQHWVKCNVNYNDGLNPTICSDMVLFNDTLLCASTENAKIIYAEFSGSLDLNTFTLNFYDTNIDYPSNTQEPILLSVFNNQFNVFGLYTADRKVFCYFCQSDFTFTTLFTDEIATFLSDGQAFATNNENYIFFVNISNETNGLLQIDSATQTYHAVSQLNFPTFSITNNGNFITVVGLDSNQLITFSYTTFNPNGICFLENCFVLMANDTYKNITLLTKQDKIKGYFSKQQESIKEIVKFQHCIKDLPIENRPYLISKDSFGKNMPNKDINVSGYHRVIVKKENNHFIGIQTFKLANCAKDSNFQDDDSVFYYHIILENKNEAVIVNNLPLESCQD